MADKSATGTGHQRRHRSSAWSFSRRRRVCFHSCASARRASRFHRGSDVLWSHSSPGRIFLSKVMSTSFSIPPSHDDQSTGKARRLVVLAVSIVFLLLAFFLWRESSKNG